MRRSPLALILVVAALACGRSDLGDDVADAAASQDSSSALDARGDDASDSPTGDLFPESGADASSSGDGTVPPPPVDASVDVTDASFADGGICGPSNCPLGCCSGFGECVQPTNQACGWAGSPCQQCPASAVCGGPMGCVVMQPTCGPSNCGGCCILSGTGGNVTYACFPGTDPVTCGSGGGPCTACSPGQECRPLLYDAGGFCQSNSTCDPTTCTGCCIGNVCAQGNQSNACGLGGIACQDCATDVCDDGKCVCGGPTGGPCDAGSE